MAMTTLVRLPLPGGRHARVHNNRYGIQHRRGVCRSGAAAGGRAHGPLRGGRTSQGLDFLLGCFGRHGVQATFFCRDGAGGHWFRDDPMRALARQIADAGHEVQLHVHPCWAMFRHADWPQRVRRQPRQDDLAGRDVASTLGLLRQGQATFAITDCP